MAASDIQTQIDAVRRFNRFYTHRIGALEEHHVRSPFSLPEARVLYEIAHDRWASAGAIAVKLGLDPGYLSRLLKSFHARGLIERQPQVHDRRRVFLRLTDDGRRAFRELNAGASAEVRDLLRRVPPDARERLLDAMRAIEAVLRAPAETPVPYVLRPHRSGDMGWVVQRHGELYAREYGWNEEFEALVAGIVARFIRRFDPRRERCWIAERDGERVGSVFLVQRSRHVAQLRLLLVEPEARGLGLGRRLVDECTRFARRRGYRKIMLWTNDVLHAARRIYEQVGYKLVKEGPHHSFGQDLVEQTWEMPLTPGRAGTR